MEKAEGRVRKYVLYVEVRRDNVEDVAMLPCVLGVTVDGAPAERPWRRGALRGDGRWCVELDGSVRSACGRVVPVGRGYVLALDVYGVWHAVPGPQWHGRKASTVCGKALEGKEKPHKLG